MTKSDAYVRDHLLIQFMLENYSPLSMGDRSTYKPFVEDIYDRWTLYLRAKEREHGKRS